MFFLLFSDGKDIMGINAREIGQRVRTLRMERKMRQVDLADELGVTLSTVGRIESGIIMVSLDLAVDISNHFCVSLDYLVLGRE